MAAARDQAARILRPEPDAAEGELRATRLPLRPNQPRAHVPEEPWRAARRRRRQHRPTDKPAAAPAGRRCRRAEIGQAQIGLDGRASRCSRSPRPATASITSWSDASTSRPTTPMCAPTTPCSAPGCPATSRRSCPATTPWSATGDVIFRIDDGDYRIAVDAARTKIATQQATIDRIGRQVTALESAAEQAKAQLASAEAALEAGRSRFRAPAGAEHQGLCLARHLRGLRSRPRPGRGGGEVGAGRL